MITVPKMTRRLSKSRYMSGLQCPKRLYLEIHARGGLSECVRPAVLEALSKGQAKDQP